MTRYFHPQYYHRQHCLSRTARDGMYSSQLSVRNSMLSELQVETITSNLLEQQSDSHAMTNITILQSGKTGSSWKHNAAQKLPRNQQTSAASFTYTANRQASLGRQRPGADWFYTRLRRQTDLRQTALPAPAPCEQSNVLNRAVAQRCRYQLGGKMLVHFTSKTTLESPL